MESWSTCGVAVGADGVAGTVVIATVVVAEGSDVATEFAAVTDMVYVIAEDKFSTTIGEDAPVAVLVVCPTAVAVTVKNVAATEPSGRAKDTEAAPLLKARFVPTFVATIFMGVDGPKKSFC
jgi:hypothetical protein